MSAVLEEIVEKVHSLPFAEKRVLREMLNNEEEDFEKEKRRRIALSKKVRGKYKESLSSVDEFLTRKREETDREDKGWNPSS